jgi:hypothetical protein
MAVWLQTEDDRIKEYRTVYGEGWNGGEPGFPEKYVTKCGQEWIIEPCPQGECYHLGCAIFLAKNQKDSGLKSSIFSIIFATGIMVLMRQDLGFAPTLILSGCSTLVAFAFLIRGLIAGKEFNELSEYMDKGTINGVNAWQIFEYLPNR